MKDAMFNLFREAARGMTRQNFLVWCTLSFLIPILSLSGTVVTSQLPQLEIMILTLDFTADALVIGIPLFLGAGFIFTTSPARHSFVTYASHSERGLRFLCAKLVLLVLMMTTYLVILIGTGFMRFSTYSTVPNSDPYYIPGFIIAISIITILITPIVALFSLSLDDWRLTIILGGSLFLAMT